jgi:DNA invertase Pin-like site-specific DNA recombinase
VTARPSKWRPRVWHAVKIYERACHHAKRGIFRLEVSERKDGTIVSLVEQCLPPIHRVETVAKKVWSAGSTVADAKQWCEDEADSRRAR